MATLEEKLASLDQEVLDTVLTDEDRLVMLRQACEAQMNKLNSVLAAQLSPEPTPLTKTVEGTITGLNLVIMEIDQYRDATTYRDAITNMHGLEVALKNEGEPGTYGLTQGGEE